MGDLITELDCYIGHADGFAYGSYDRLTRMRKKGIPKPAGNKIIYDATIVKVDPIGPNNMYKYPGSDAMKFGFWRDDPFIVGQTWYKPAKFHPAKTSEMSKYEN